MSTPDIPGVSQLALPSGALPSGETPGELRLASAALPTAGATPTLPAAGASTPGASGASARVPGAPTLPDFDPVSLTSLVSRLANDLFAQPPAQFVGAPEAEGSTTMAEPPTPPALAPSVPSTSHAVPLAEPAAPSELHSPAALGGAHRGVPAAPFEAPLDFGAMLTTPHPFSPVFGDGVFQFPLNEYAAEDRDRAAPLPRSAEPAAMPEVPYEITNGAQDLPSPTGNAPLDGNILKREFPILRQSVNGRPLVWLDNAATTQKPQTVIDRLSRFYEHENSNIHRAAHTLAARATDAYESARESVRRFINAGDVREIVFVRGATEGINLIAQSWGRRNVGPGDEIVISWLEHHANIVPWQQLASEKGARIRVAPVDDDGQIIIEEYEKLLNDKTRLVSFTQVSNALGTITPAKEMIQLAHRHGAVVVLDGAQAVSHKRVDVQDLNCDFYVFSGHKVFAPTGIGVVYGRSELLEHMPPWQGGGNMIADVTFERTVFQPPPARFEAGTGNIADAVGLGAALDWLTRVGIEQVERYEHELLVYGTERLRTVPGLTMVGTAKEKAGVLSFVLAGQKTEQVGGMLDREGIAVRSGHHCAQPILRRFGLEASVRASLAPYNTHEDLDALVAALHRIQAGQAGQA
jgi:cysteine desulfurase / selenocysteine lyase